MATWRVKRGADGRIDRIRTCDLLDVSEALCWLSYDPEIGGSEGTRTLNLRLAKPALC